MLVSVLPVKRGQLSALIVIWRQFCQFQKHQLKNVISQPYAIPLLTLDSVLKSSHDYLARRIGLKFL